MTALRTCRICGCDDHHACVTEAGPCWWVEDDLCSACAAIEDDPLPQRVGAVLAAMAATPSINPTFARALREAQRLDDVAEASLDAAAQDHVEGARR